MCLETVYEIPFPLKLNEEGYVEAYKVVHNRKGHLGPIWHSYGEIFKIGLTIARRHTYIQSGFGAYKSGLHCFLNHPDATVYKDMLMENRYESLEIIRVSVKPEWITAFGDTLCWGDCEFCLKTIVVSQMQINSVEFL